MHKFLKSGGFAKNLPNRQSGGITLFAGVMILILLTQMTIYAVHSGVFEQRKSGHEARQKRAFHIAESGIRAGKQFIAENAFLVSSDVDSALPDGTDGWFSASGPRWVACSTADLSDVTHPCNAEADSTRRGASYFYEFGNSMELPVNSAEYSDATDDEVEVYAVLCMLDLDPDSDPVVQGCTTVADDQDEFRWMVTLAARGRADCQGGSCNSEALITQQFGSFGPATGGDGPGAPLTTWSTVPPNGTAEIVANPNGNGVGVPVSAWLSINEDPECEGTAAIDGEGGSWATCERAEWYETMEMPEDFVCPTSNCSCGSNERRLSYAESGDMHIGIDIIEDPNFPCDLFEYTFGYDKSDYEQVKIIAKVIPNCESLGPNSSGLYWVEGTCALNGGVQVGSPNAPVFLVGAGSVTRCNGGAELFGTLFVTDAENSDAAFYGTGNCTVYGAGIVDAELDHYNGTFQIVWLGDIVDRASGGGLIGTLPGGWNDNPPVWR